MPALGQSGRVRESDPNRGVIEVVRKEIRRPWVILPARGVAAARSLTKYRPEIPVEL
jgi:hypothetical protein